MPVILIALFSGLASVAGTIAGRVVLALGFQYVTYTGFDAVLSSVVSGIANTSGLPGVIASYVGFFRLSEAASIISGALTTRWAISGLSNGSLTRMVLK